MVDLRSKIREIPNFPREGILFYDITTLLKDAVAMQRAVDKIADYFEGDAVQKVVAVESRGFILGAPVAYRLGVGFVPVRKAGKLPSDVYEAKYDLEYGSGALAIHQDAVSPGERIIIVDDLLATGGTIAATIDLVKQLGADVVGVAFLVELGKLKGRDKLAGYNVLSLINY